MRLLDGIKKLAADHRRREAHGVNVYTRETGPIAYEVSLRRNTPDLGAILLDSALDWWWESAARVYPEESSSASVPPAIRTLCLLTSVSIDDFASDFDFIDEDGEGKDITIFGFTRGADVPLDSLALSREVSTFINSEPSRLEMVVHLFLDSHYGYLFVSQKPSETVSTLLPDLGVTPQTIVRTIPYKRLNLAILENLASSILR